MKKKCVDCGKEFNSKKITGVNPKYLKHKYKIRCASCEKTMTERAMSKALKSVNKTLGELL